MDTGRLLPIFVSARSAFGSASLILLCVAFHEAFVAPSVAGGARVMAAVVSMGLPFAIGSALLAVGFAGAGEWGWRRVRSTLRGDSPSAARHLAQAVCVLGLAALAPRAAARIESLEGWSHGVVWAGLTVVLWIAFALATSGLAHLYGSLRRRLSTRGRAPAHAMLLSGLAVAFAFAFHTSMFRLIDVMGWWDLVALVTVILAGLIGPSLGRSRPPRVVFVFAGLTALGFASWNAIAPLNREDRVVIEQGTRVLGAAMRRIPISSGPTAPSAGAGSCWPDVAPATDVARITAEAPDILLFMADGVRFDFTSMGGDRSLTPNLARWSRQAAVFTRAYTPAPSTRQSFRSIFTGLLPGVVASPPQPRRAPWGVTIADGQSTMASYLQRSGYSTTALVQKRDAFPAEGGALNGFGVVDFEPREFARRNGYVTGFLVNRILGKWASTHRADAPRFLWTHSIDPHFPYSYPAGVGPRRHASDLLRYEGSLRYVDQELDRLLRWARSPERRDNTWVIVTSDHGEGWGEHGNRRHGSTVFEEEIRVPLLIWGPGVEGRRHEAPVSLVDLLPTVLSIAGLAPPPSGCGRSLLGAMTDGEILEGPVFVAALPDTTRSHHHLAYIRGDEKLIVSGRTSRVSLYDLANDPSEREDLADASPERLAEALHSLKAFLSERGMAPSIYGLPEGI